jgi:hypothetical protein
MRTCSHKRLRVVYAMTCIIASCSSANFKSGGTTTSSQEQKKSGAPNPTVNPSDPISPNAILSEEGKIELKQKCWFAVSGTLMGASGYGGQFPTTLDGSPISHGKRFDNAGGIFLEPRTNPYVYKDSEGLIDDAVNGTFDSIAVSPNMHVTIQSTNGNILFDQDGPVIGISTYYSTNSNNHSDMRSDMVKLLLARPNLPQWMKDSLTKNKSVSSIGLYSWTQDENNYPHPSPDNLDHAATWVKVSAVPGSPCDQSSLWK